MRDLRTDARRLIVAVMVASGTPEPVIDLAHEALVDSAEWREFLVVTATTSHWLATRAQQVAFCAQLRQQDITYHVVPVFRLLEEDLWDALVYELDIPFELATKEEAPASDTSAGQGHTSEHPSKSTTNGTESTPT